MTTSTAHATYPVHVDADLDPRLNRGLWLVTWLLAVPHFLIIALFTGGVAYGVGGAGDKTWISISLLGVLVLVAGVVLLFTGRYPQQVFDLVLGINRWVLRVAGYVSLMTDEYPPFRLDMGGHEPPAAVLPPVDPTAGTPGDRSGWTAGRVVSAVAGSLLVLTGLALAGAGGTLALIGATERDDGFLMTPTTVLASDTFAITSEDAKIDTEGAPSWVPAVWLGDVRIRARSDTGEPLFVGVAATSDVEGYLGDVSHDTLSEFRAGNAVLGTTDGGAPVTGPTDQTFWVAQATGADATLTWDLQGGDWTVVLMHADGTRGVSADVSTGAELPVVNAVVAVLFVLAGLTLLAGALLIAVPVRNASRRE